jgi:hypothetical protein
VTNVGGEFGFGYSASGFLRGTNWGTASLGHSTTALPGNFVNCNGVTLDNPVSLDGINFGLALAAAGYNLNGGLAAVPVISNAAKHKCS